MHPAGPHVDAAVAALKAGVHVVVEKPATLSLAEIDRIAEAEAGSTAKFTQVVQHRFGHGARQLRRLLDDGELGRPLVATCDTLWFRAPEYFEVPWRGRWDTEGGGPTMGHGIHQFDLLLATARPVDRGDGDGRPSRPARGHRGRLDGDRPVRERRDGDHRQLPAVPARDLRPAVRHRGGDHRAVAPVRVLDADWTFTPAKGRDDVGQLWQPDPTALPSGHLAQLVPTYRAFAAGEVPPVTVADARGTLELVAAIYRSAFTGAVVRAGEIGPGDPFHESMRGSGPAWAPVKDVDAAPTADRGRTAS